MEMGKRKFTYISRYSYTSYMNRICTRALNNNNNNTGPKPHFFTSEGNLIVGLGSRPFMIRPTPTIVWEGMSACQATPWALFYKDLT